MRGDVDLGKMTQIEAKLVSSLMHTYYLQQDKFEKYVHRFNKQPRDFNFDALLGDLSLIQQKRQEEDEKVEKVDESWTEGQRKDRRDGNLSAFDHAASQARIQEASPEDTVIGSSGTGNIVNKAVRVKPEE
eukprot:TRINITY_DN14939_c0_g1_i2.p1 TRINITY_DN14939_c0_g1~~TRINITY_DN14939_c0_g1_i2.p1  ORF type:complete len:131 (+),score=34.27 TRINITY_DN14939_c0_g1_i2:269-661(+)